jgi:predicted RNase H-like HicB family nuclease
VAVLLRDTSGAQVESDLNPDLRIALAAPPSEPTISWPDPGEAPVSEDRLPRQLIERYVKLAVWRASAEQMSDGRWYAEVMILPGVWAEGNTESGALAQLVEVVRGWVLLKIEDHDRDIPRLETLDLNGL